MHELTNLANKYNSDKGTVFGSKHGFTEDYGPYFEKYKCEKINILEIGINDGSSLRMWYDYFPHATIVGIDIDDKLTYNNDRTFCGILDQSNSEHLKHFVVNTDLNFDIIIDDGSHHISDQQLTFGHLFPLVRPGGIYIIEDLHTSLSEPGTMVYGRPLENNLERTNTTLTYLKSRPYTSIYLSKSQNEYVQENIQEVLIFERDNMNVPYDYKNKSITTIIIKK